jgi:hypothetical protein
MRPRFAAVGMIVLLGGCKRESTNMAVPPKNAGVLSKLPEELHYLIEPVLRCGCRTEPDVFAFLDQAKKEEIDKFGQIAKRVLKNNHYPVVLKFLKKYEMTEHEECAKLYFFFGVLDYADLQFDREENDD